MPRWIWPRARVRLCEVRRLGTISLALALVGVSLHRAMPVLLRWVWRVPRPDTPEELDARGMRVRIRGVRDKWLAGRFLEPAGGTSEGTVLVMHGWGGMPERCSLSPLRSRTRDSASCS